MASGHHRHQIISLPRHSQTFFLPLLDSSTPSYFKVLFPKFYSTSFMLNLMTTSYLCPTLSAASDTTATPSMKYSLPCFCCCLAFWCSPHPSDDYSFSSVDISSSAIPQMCVPVRICHALPYLSTCTVPWIFYSSPIA